MNHRECVAEREARDPVFRAAREALRPEYEFRGSLIAARLRAGLTQAQAQVADPLGTTHSAIARLENGKRTPTVETLRRLAEALGIRFEIGAGGLIIHSATYGQGSMLSRPGINLPCSPQEVTQYGQTP